VRVKRGEVTLPIGETPNLLAETGSGFTRLSESQTAHYVLIVAFLRGPPTAADGVVYARGDWTREAQREGVFVTVPEEAQQALIFLAPETGGDFSICARR